MNDDVIYFALDEMQDLIKIGKSSIHSIQSRLSNLQTGSPNQLRLIGVIRGDLGTESQIHEMFHEFHHRGEWFRRHPDIIEFIKKSDDFELLEYLPPNVYKVQNI